MPRDGLAEASLSSFHHTRLFPFHTSPRLEAHQLFRGGDGGLHLLMAQPGATVPVGARGATPGRGRPALPSVHTQRAGPFVGIVAVNPHVCELGPIIVPI